MFNCVIRSVIKYFSFKGITNQYYCTHCFKNFFKQKIKSLLNRKTTDNCRGKSSNIKGSWSCNIAPIINDYVCQCPITYTISFWWVSWDLSSTSFKGVAALQLTNLSFQQLIVQLSTPAGSLLRQNQLYQSIMELFSPTAVKKTTLA